MKITSAIPVPLNSPTPAQHINKLPVTPSTMHDDTNRSNNTISIPPQQHTATITTKLSPVEQRSKVESALLKFEVYLEKRDTAVKDTVSETQRVLAEVGSEQPSLLTKTFDFTHTGDEIEVINHNLSDREYNYLKAKLNGNDKLVEATGFLNTALATEKSGPTASGDHLKYTEEDVAGRIHIRDVIERAQKKTEDYIASHQPGMISKTSNQKYMDTDDTLINTLNIILSTGVSFKAIV
ncbi:hypothetical protein [uncultured Shewanella sp.]|uniref:hypothetical protein n=1 Tax=uncultured Shewanella sp. TaxID=173975 RepID=UPI00261D1E1F|nr:hypothetical protein [uncultured Shewanella sp.]